MLARTVASVCPHDCPSCCALEVERLDESTIGRVYGGEANTYTAGVVCAKVARYAERQHHADRLTRPLLRSGSKGEAAFRDTAVWLHKVDVRRGRLTNTMTTLETIP